MRPFSGFLVRFVVPILVTVAWAASSAPAATEIVWLDELDVDRALIGCGTPQRNATVDGKPLTIGGRVYERGFGTHAESLLRIELYKATTTFKASVGVDDECDPRPGEKSPSSVEFQVIGDKELLWRSGVLKADDPPQEMSVDLTGIETLWLVVTGAGDGINTDHADWADARFEVVGKHPKVNMNDYTKPYVLTPKPPRAPRINGPKVFGVRPGSPFVFTIPATGDRPIHFAARDLPEGLALDEKTGRITGTLSEPGEHTVTLVAKNVLGEAERPFRIVVGEAIALTPPLGWNHWNCWASRINEAKIRAAAKAMVDTGLINHGWSYINIDDNWQGVRGGEFNAIQGDANFPDMQGLCDYVHSLGLKVGLYSSPWAKSYAGRVGGTSDFEDGAFDPEIVENKCGKYSFAENDATQWAAWGIDFLKYDWTPNDVPHTKDMTQALRACGRDIVFSLSNNAPFELAAEWARLAQCWRTTGDIRDNWERMSEIGFDQDKWAPFAGPGHWNDPDMLVVGVVGWGPHPRPSRLTPDEQYTHISLWCLLAAPLLLGCDLTQLDEFTLNLLTNDEVLNVNQDPAGHQARRVRTEHDPSGAPLEVWAKDMEDGSKAVGFFNRGLFESEINIDWATLGLTGPQRVRDLWRQKDLGTFTDTFTATVRPHGVVLVRIRSDSEK